MLRTTLPVRRLHTLPVTIALAAMLTALLTVLAGPPASAGSWADKDCADFPSQRAAQLFFLRQGGPAVDPHRLDADGDNVACDSNPPPRYEKPFLPGKPGKPSKPTRPRKPKPPKVIDSTASLVASHAQRIAGEPFTLKGRVTPAVKRRVVLQGRLVGGRWQKLVTAQTSRNGRIVFTGRASAKDVRYRLVVPASKKGKKRYTATKSPVRLIDTVRQTVTLEVPTSVANGTDVNAVITSTPARRNRPVLLQVEQNGSWTVLKRGRLDSVGVATLRFTRPTGSYDLRAVVQKYRGAGKVTSGTRTIVFLAAPDTTPPDAPTGLDAQPGDGSATLTWEAVDDAVAYRVRYRESSAADWTDWPQVAGTTTTITGLTNDVEYTFDVRAVDAANNVSEPSETVTIVPTNATG
ncbi:excalibur calcium-binding domain-containing protein [Nocardioides caldifontis]|uniref:excalibur calcium-binding domain-containing protein n=1 Tax=Nocardioides caldifontis TaxID=2588938 RepID=UPI0011DF8D66|nr:fibronectin type III domain-containing protein [Nocardioides caldifontis]